MLRFFICFFIVVGFTIIKAQTIDKLYSSNDNLIANRAVNAEDGNVICVLQKIPVLTTYRYTVIVKMDSVGNILTTKELVSPGSCLPHDIIAIDSSRFLILCGFEDSITLVAQNILFCIDTSLNILWSKNYMGLNNAQLVNIIYDEQRQKIMACGNINYEFNIDTIDYVSSFLIVELDLLGNIIWHREYDLNRADFFYSIHKSKTNEYILVGVTKWVTQFQQNAFIETHIDTLGNVIYTKRYKYDLVMAIDSNYNIYRSFLYGNNNTAGRLLTKHDNNGNIIFSKIIGYNWLPNPRVEVIKLFDDLIVIPISHPIHVFDTLGNQLYLADLIMNNPYVNLKAREVIQIENKNLLVFYLADSFPYYKQNMLLHEENPHSINASGCYATNFNLASLDDNNDSTTQVYLYDTNFVFMELPISTPLINYTITQATLCSTGYADAREDFTRISIYPNPVNDLINFELKNVRQKQIIKINIYSAQGSLLLTKIFHESSFQMDLKKFTPSLYLVEIIINGQFVSMQKIIKI